MLDVVVGAILIITAIDVRGKYTLSRVVNQSGGTRPYVFDREALAYFLDLFTRGALQIIAGTSTRNHYAVFLLEVSRLTNNQMSSKKCIEI